MDFNDVFTEVQKLTRAEIVKNGRTNTPPVFPLTQIDQVLELDVDSREHIMSGTQPIGKVNRTTHDIALTDTEYEKLAADVEVSKKIGDGLNAIIRKEVDKILKEYKLIP